MFGLKTILKNKFLKIKKLKIFYCFEIFQKDFQIKELVLLFLKRHHIQC